MYRWLQLGFVVRDDLRPVHTPITITKRVRESLDSSLQGCLTFCCSLRHGIKMAVVAVYFITLIKECLLQSKQIFTQSRMMRRKLVPLKC